MCARLSAIWLGIVYTIVFYTKPYFITQLFLCICLYMVFRSCNARAHQVDLLRTRQGPFLLEHCLHEHEWNFDSICEHIIATSKLVDLDVSTIRPAVEVEIRATIRGTSKPRVPVTTE